MTAVLEMFFDGDCPLCLREVRMLRRLDRHHRIAFTDVAALDFDAAAYGTTYAELMARIRARTSDGTWLDGADVFRRVYELVGLRRLVALSRLPGVRWLVDRAYDLFAANRLRLTGRCPLPPPSERRTPDGSRAPSSPAC